MNVVPPPTSPPCNASISTKNLGVQEDFVSYSCVFLEMLMDHI